MKKILVVMLFFVCADVYAIQLYHLTWMSEAVSSCQSTYGADCETAPACDADHGGWIYAVHANGAVPAGYQYNHCVIPVDFDCYNSYDDLDPFTSGIQCSCGGFFPKDLSYGSQIPPLMTCDGVASGCKKGYQPITYTMTDHEPINGCTKIDVCDPLTDSNQCDGDLDVNSDGGACVTSDSNDPCLEDDFFDDDGTLPDVCLKGYYFNGVNCSPITKIETVIDDKTGNTTQTTTTNNGDTNNTTNNTNTTNTETGDEVKDSDPDADDEEENWPDFGSGDKSSFDLVQAESDLSSVKTDFSNLINTIKSDSSVMFSLVGGVGVLPCYDFPNPYDSGFKRICLSKYDNFFDILATVLTFIGYFIALFLILRN